MLDPYVALARIARAQYGAFTTAQARGVAVSETTLYRDARIGRFIRAYDAVYLDPAVPRTPEQDAIAACLACGPDAFVSDRTSARMWNLDVPAAPRPEVTVPSRSNPRPPGVEVRRTVHIGPLDVVTLRGIRVSGPMRTLVDIAGSVDEEIVEISLDALWRRKLLHPERLLAYLGTPWCRTRPGSGVLRRLTRMRVGQQPPGSDLETLYLRLLRRYGLPLPVCQYPVETADGLKKIDGAYPDHMVAIELEGFEIRMSDRRIFDRGLARHNVVSTTWDGGSAASRGPTSNANR